MLNNFVVYKFTSPSGKSYIGQTNNIKRRTDEHKIKNKCRAFNGAITKYGFENFSMTILKENLTIEESNHWESFYIEEYASLSPGGYNLRTGGDSSIPSIETREKMSAWQTGRKRPDIAEKTRAFHTGRKASDEARAKMSVSQTGRKHSEETKAKMSVVQTGIKKRPRTIEERKKQSELTKGMKRSEEQRKRMSDAAKKRPPPSAETRKKISDKNKGKIKIFSDSHRANISLSKKGKKKSPESVAKTAYAKCKLYLVTNKNNESIVVRGMKPFCRENNLHAGHMFSVAKGRAESYKGWKCEYLTQEKAALINIGAA